MKHHLKTCITIGLAAFAMARTQAAITLLDFEGLGNLEPVADFYNGGLGGNGSGPGPNLGVTFGGNALAIIDADAGGTGNIGGEPSPSTVLFFLTGPAATMTLATGFDTGFSFYYSAINNPGFINVYDGPNGTGNILASLNLPTTPFNGAPDPTGQFSPLVPIGVAFAGTALSVDFGGTVNQIAFDNITFGSDIPVPPTMPDAGASAALLGIGVAALAGLRSKKA